MKNLTIDEFEIMLEATGYLPPSNEPNFRNTII